MEPSVTGFGLKFQQLWTLILKRFHHYRRNWRMAITIVILPLLAFAAAMGFTFLRPDATEMPNLIMDPALYSPDNFAFFQWVISPGIVAITVIIFILVNRAVHDSRKCFYVNSKEHLFVLEGIVPGSHNYMLLTSSKQIIFDVWCHYKFQIVKRKFCRFRMRYFTIYYFILLIILAYLKSKMSQGMQF